LPRWAAGKRTGDIELSFKLSFDSEEAERLDADAIFDRLCADLSYNEYEFQERNQIRFRGRRRAEKIEQVLYACPHCLRFGTLFSRDDRLRCAGCGYGVTYDEFGFLRPGADQPEYYRNVHSWNMWQSEHLIGYLKRSIADGGEAWDHRHRPLLRKGRITLSTGYRSQPLKRHPPGVLSLHSDGLLYTSRDGGTRLFPFGEIGGANVQNNERLEFYHDRTLFSFRSATRQSSSYQWVNALTVMKAIELGEGDAVRTHADIQVRQQEGRLRYPTQASRPAES
ncbi:MAG TPA: hypothetical protein VMW87_11550, partial [Spirochaetia bacterium]|nr:hypothetical protein [Spirochaetia bacterium]